MRVYGYIEYVEQVFDVMAPQAAHQPRHCAVAIGEGSVASPHRTPQIRPAYILRDDRVYVFRIQFSSSDLCGPCAAYASAGGCTDVVVVAGPSPYHGSVRLRMSIAWHDEPPADNLGWTGKQELRRVGATSEHEQRMPEEIENALYAEDPKFASSVKSRRSGRPTDDVGCRRSRCS